MVGWAGMGEAVAGYGQGPGYGQQRVTRLLEAGVQLSGAREPAEAAHSTSMTRPRARVSPDLSS